MTVTDGGSPVASAKADQRGEWVMLPDKPLPPGTRELNLTETRPGAETPVPADKVVVVTVPDPAAKSAESAAQNAPAPIPTAPMAVAVPRDGLAGAPPTMGGSSLLQAPPVPDNGAPAPPGGVSVETMDYDPAGRVALGGRAAPNSAVQLYLDNILVGSAHTDPKGNWRLTPEKLIDPGVYTLRADQVTQGGKVVARADKLETLVGLFGIGSLPTGDRDPFALRRHALGVIRMLAEKQLPLDLPALLDAAARPFGALLADPAQSNAQLLAFIHERMAGYLRELGASTQEADAVIAAPLRASQLPQALAAVRAFAQLPEAPALAAANKRVGNILKKAEGEVGGAVQPGLLREAAEKALYDALQAVAPQADAAFEQGDYTASLQRLAALKSPVDAFFDGVMVNADDPALKANRLRLLQQLHRAMNRVADLSRLAA